jgi:hypothetical protein
LKRIKVYAGLSGGTTVIVMLTLTVPELVARASVVVLAAAPLARIATPSSPHALTSKSGEPTSASVLSVSANDRMHTSPSWTAASKAPPCGGTRNSASERWPVAAGVGWASADSVLTAASSTSTPMNHV